MESDTRSVTISKLVKGLPRLHTHDATMEEHETEYNLSPTVECTDKSSYIGIEVEVENVRNVGKELIYWQIKEDGSLRNRGREFVTYPIRAARAEFALKNLFYSLNPDIDFSERTSIHVHLNVRTFTMPQIETFLLTYLLFEKVLFSYVAPNRYSNIFCVPICETQYGELIKSSLKRKDPNFSWSKYTALNLLPILDKGTIEFRHLQGTSDIRYILNWINIILCIKKFAFKNTPEYIKERISDLNSTSQYRDVAHEVFGRLTNSLLTPDFSKLMEECDSYIKESCFINPFEDEIKKISPKSRLAAMSKPEEKLTTTEQLLTSFGSSFTTRAFTIRQPVITESNTVLDELMQVQNIVATEGRIPPPNPVAF